MLGTIIDPETGDNLEKRADDRGRSNSKKNKIICRKTLPVIEEYRKIGNIIEINANQSIDKVFKELVQKLELK
ncbi:MAG: hypothetical protein Q9M97_01765 [Candidatus Gracilibacteria bacterium]|nr:hypothetical protein [Candidatus Gracilibacteria bacterium]